MLKRANQSRDLEESSDDGRKLRKQACPTPKPKPIQTETGLKGLPPGPSSYPDLFDWHNDLVRRIMQLWRLKHIRTTTKKIRVLLTTSYSGAGFAEAAASMVASAFRKHTFFDVEIVLHSQTEMQEICHSLLTAPHVFENLLHRVDEQVVMALRELQTKRRDELSQDRRLDKEEVGNHFFREACDILAALGAEDVRLFGYCVKCDNLCRWAPTKQVDPDVTEVWVEIGGNTCTPWSARGKKFGWLDAANIPALIWGWSLKMAGPPDIVLNECTPLWPAYKFWTGVFHQPLKPIVESVKFSPVDMGTLAAI